MAGRLGRTSFGGPIAHLGSFQDECGDRSGGLEHGPLADPRSTLIDQAWAATAAGGEGGATGGTGATLRHRGIRAPALEVPGGGHGGRMRRRCTTRRRRPVAAAGCPLGPISPLTGPTWPRRCAASPSGARMELQGPASLPCPASGARPTADCEPTPTTRGTVPPCSRSWVSRSIRTRWRRPWPNGERTTWAQLFDLLSAWDAADGSHPAHQVARRAVRADRGPR